MCGSLALGLLVLALAGVRALPARADVSGFGADESISQAAGPLAVGTLYTGAFSSAQDVDYLYFEVPQPETLRFDVVNTLSSCHPYWIEAAPGEPARYYEPFPTCPMWATLIDEHGQQLGGEGSAAGTGPVEYSSYEEVEWTFPAAGRYYLVLESEYCGRHTAECQLPSFQLSYRVVPPAESGGGGTSGGGTTSGGGAGTSGGGGGPSGAGSGSKGATGGAGPAPGGPLAGAYESRAAQSPRGAGSSHSLIRSLSAARRQRGARVIVSLTVAQRLLSLDAWVLARAAPRRRLTIVGHLLRRHPIAGRERLAIPVKAGSSLLPPHRFVPVVVRVRAIALSGAVQLFQRRVLLRP
jgi:hypothetical protein